MRASSTRSRTPASTPARGAPGGRATPSPSPRRTRGIEVASRPRRMASTVETLAPRHLEPLKALLAREPAHNLYLLGLLEEFGIVPSPGRAHFAFWGRFLSGELTAAVFVGGAGGMVVPSSNLP